MVGRLIKLERAIFRLVLGMLMLLSFAPAEPAVAETAVLPGSFTVQLVIFNITSSAYQTLPSHGRQTAIPHPKYFTIPNCTLI
jgi:hypothetical protein